MEEHDNKNLPHRVRLLRRLLWCAMMCVMAVMMSVSPPQGGGGDRSDDFEKAVNIIKKYEGLHRGKGRFVGYGHMIMPGEKYKSGTNLTPAQADALLRDDLRKLCARYRKFGKDSLLLGALAYNIGIGNVAKSTVYKKISSGNRNIRESYLSISKYRGKTLKKLRQRRIEEYDSLFIP